MYMFFLSVSVIVLVILLLTMLTLNYLSKFCKSKYSGLYSFSIQHIFIKGTFILLNTSVVSKNLLLAVRSESRSLYIKVYIYRVFKTSKHATDKSNDQRNKDEWRIL